MTNRADIPPRSILWEEGMLLSPQHFQQISMRSDELLHYHIMASAPFHWGIRALKTDGNLLLGGMFRVLELEAIMPDGAIIRHDPSRAIRALEADLTRRTGDMKSKILTIHLGIPEKKSEGSMTSGESNRYDISDGEKVADLYTGESNVTIRRMIPHARLFVTESDSESPPQFFTTFPLARIKFENGKYSPTNYIPPVLESPLSSPLHDICSSVVNILRKKALFLSEKARKESMILGTKFLIHSLVSGLPQFEAVIGTGVSHPYVIYLSLCSLVGNIAAISPGQTPPQLPPYDHNNILLSIETAGDYITDVVEKGIFVSHSIIEFNYEKGIFSLALKKEWLTEDLIVGVRGKPGVKEDTILEWMNKSLIGSVSQIDKMQKTRILGTVREQILDDEEIVPPKGVILFSLKNDPGFIKINEELQIFHSSEKDNVPDPAKIRLYVKKQQ